MPPLLDNWEQSPSCFRSQSFPGDPDSSSSHPVLKNDTVTPTTLGCLPPLVFSPNTAALILKNKPLPAAAAKVLREVAMLVLSGIPWWLSSPRPFSAQLTPSSLQIHPSFYKWHIHLPFLQAKITGVVYKLWLRSFLINSRSKKPFQSNPFPSSPPDSQSPLGTQTSCHCHQNFLVKPNGWCNVWTFLI